MKNVLGGAGDPSVAPEICLSDKCITTTVVYGSQYCFTRTTLDETECPAGSCASCY